VKTKPPEEQRVCARCRKALASGEPVQCFTPSWCANWPGTTKPPGPSAAMVEEREIRDIVGRCLRDVNGSQCHFAGLCGPCHQAMRLRKLLATHADRARWEADGKLREVAVVAYRWREMLREECDECADLGMLCVGHQDAQTDYVRALDRLHRLVAPLLTPDAPTPRDGTPPAGPALGALVEAVAGWRKARVALAVANGVNSVLDADATSPAELRKLKLEMVAAEAALELAARAALPPTDPTPRDLGEKG
jgi:hypothetical protein